MNANQLSLGCDCLGHIKYFDAYRNDSKGNSVHLKNVVCMHEQDNGLQHKHTNYRTGAATAVRNRQLVLQMICTVANYEYIFAYIFDQAGNIELEVRATGILSTVPLDNENGHTVPWGTNVGPGVMAPFHQHMFSFRIDPAIDGFKNTIYYEDSVPMPEDENNPWLVGYTTESTVMRTSGAADTSVDRHRVFKIRNDNVTNPMTYKPVSYKLQTAPSQMLLLSKNAIGYRRAEFATRPIWVTKYQDDELYAAGEFTNQSRRASGVETWVQRKDNIQNEDVVLWHSKYSLKQICINGIVSDMYLSLRTHPQPPRRRLPRHAYGARQRDVETRWLLHQESRPGCASIFPGLQQIHSTSRGCLLRWFVCWCRES